MLLATYVGLADAAACVALMLLPSVLVQVATESPSDRELRESAVNQATQVDLPRFVGVQSGIYFLKIRSVKSPRSGLPIHAPTAKAITYPEARAMKEIT